MKLLIDITIHYFFRANVIRSLHYLYKPFVVRLRRPQVLVCDPHDLKGMVCVKHWHERKGKDHHFFVKFAKSAATRKSKKAKRVKDNNISDSLMWDEDDKEFNDLYDDLDFNPEDGCRLLHFHCDAFNILTSQIVGQKLSDVCLTMSGQGFRYQKLSLNFVPMHARSIQCSDLNTVDVHNIISMKILNWFHPLYLA